MKKDDITSEDIKNLHNILEITEEDIVSEGKLVARIYSFQDTSDTVSHNYSKIIHGNSLNISVLPED